MAQPERYPKIKQIVYLKAEDLFTGDKAISEDLIMLLIAEIEQVIINYCFLPDVPVALDYTWANMVVDTARYEAEKAYKPTDPMDVIDPSDLSSVKVGDTSVFIGDKYRSNLRSLILQTHTADLDDIIYSYRSQLNRFRRLL